MTFIDIPFQIPTNNTKKVQETTHHIEQTLFYTKTTKTMSSCSSLDQNQEILIKESSKDRKSSNFPLRTTNPSNSLIREASKPVIRFENDEEDDVEDEESEFKMGRLIRQASLNSSQMSTPRQTTKIMTGSSSLPRYSSQKPKTNQENIKLEKMNDENRSKNSMKMVKKKDGAPMVPGGWVDKGSSEDMKEQIKFWARAVAFNLHQEC